MTPLSDRPRALITGLGGFTGKYVADELRRSGYEVFGTCHGRQVGDAATCFMVDICDSPRLQEVVERVQPEVVVHLAAISFVAHGDADAIYCVNVLGTRNLLAALAGLTRTPRAILLASSANVYGNTSVGLIDETVIAAPANDYAVSKLAMEYMARLWMDRLIFNRNFISRPIWNISIGFFFHFYINDFNGLFLM